MDIEYFSIFSLIISFAMILISIKKGIMAHLNSNIVQNELIKDDNIKNEELDPLVTNEAIFKLSSYAHKIQPDFIVGVNRGGTMVGAFIALGLGVQSDSFVRCLVSRKNGHKVGCDVKNIYGTVLVIDDICRSGKTIEAAINEIKNKHSNIKKIYSSVLVTTLDENKRPAYLELDFFAYAVSDKNVYLPWTPKNKSQPNYESTRVELYKEVRKKSLNMIAKEMSNALYL